MPMDWRGYWETDGSVYVSARHKSAHYALLAEDLLGVLGSLEKPLSELSVLDFGCGEALSAGRIAARIGHLALSDGSERVRRQLIQRYAGTRNIEVLASADAGRLEAGAYDLVVVNSVLQYVDEAAAASLLRSLARTLRPGGRILIGDILPPGLSPLTDARELITFAAREGFLLAALAGLARTAVSDYAKVRARVGLTRYAPEDLLRLAAASGLVAERLDRNIGHNSHRLAFLARP